MRKRREKYRAPHLSLNISNDKMTTVDRVCAMMVEPVFEDTRTPGKVGNVFDFMACMGTFKTKPAGWKDLFFPEVHGLPGD